MITFYKADETDFDNNGLGVLDHDIQNPDIEEKLNDIFTFSFNYPIFGVNGSRLAARMIVKADDPENEGQLFRIMKLSKSNGMLTAFCYHIFYDLNGNEIPDTNIVDQNGQTAITQMLSKTAVAHKFQGFSDITETANIRVVRMSPVKFLIDPQTDNNFINRLGGEIRRVNYRIWMNKVRGSDNGATIRWKKSLDSYNATWDYTTIATRIRPVGYNGIMLPESYVGSPLIDKYETIVIKEIQYSDIKAIDPNATSNDETAVPLEEAYELLRQAAAKEFSENNLDKPTVTLSVNMVALRNMDEYKDVKSLETISPWDTVTVINERDGLSVKVRLNHYRWNPVTRKFISMELGNAKSTFTDIGSKVDHATNLANQANDTANTAAESANGKNSNYYGLSEPSRPVDGDLWYKKNGDKTELWQYDGKSVPPGWKLVVDDATGEEVRQNVDAAQKEAEESKKTANESVAAANDAVAKAGFANDTATQAKSDAATAGQQAKDALTSAGTAITDAQKALTNSSSAMADSTQARKDSAAAAADAAAAKGQAANALGQANTAINNAANALNKVNNMSVGGRNYLLGSATITPVDNQHNWAVVANKSTDTFNGLTVTEGVGAWSAMKYSLIWLYATAPINLQDEYTASIWIMNTSTQDNVPIRFYCDASDKSGTLATYLPAKSDWVRISQTFRFNKTSDQLTWSMRIRFENFVGITTGDGFIQQAGFKLEKGNQATDWSPAPEDVQQQFTDINGELSQKVSQTTYNVLAGTVDTVNTLAKQNQSTISTLATKTSVDTVNHTATTAQTLAQQNANELLNKANSTTVNTLTQRVTTAESTLKQTATTAQLALTQKDIDDLNDTVTSNTAGMTANANALKLKADSSTVSSLDGRVTKLSGQLDVQADKIAATVTANDVTGMLNGYATQTWTQSQIKTTADQINLSVTKVQTDLSGTKTQFAELAVKADGIQTTVSGKADQSQVTQLAGQITSVVGDVSANSSQITQMKSDINLRVKAGDVVNQINISPEEILIDGKKVHITGQTRIDNAVIKDAMIEDIKADKITAGTLNAANVNVINLNANNITAGTLKGANLSMNLNTGEVLFQKGAIRSTNGNLNIDVNDGTLSIADSLNRGVIFRNGIMSLSDITYGSNVASKYGTVSFEESIIGSLGTGMKLSGAHGTLVGMPDYHPDSLFSPTWQFPTTGGVGISKNYLNVEAARIVALISGKSYLSMFGSESPTVQVGAALSYTAGRAWTLNTGSELETESGSGSGSNVWANGKVIAMEASGSHTDSTGSSVSDLSLAVDGRSGYVLSMSAYRRTYSSGETATITGNGVLGTISSASKYKLAIGEISTINDEAHRFLSVKPKQWFDKAESDTVADMMTTGNDNYVDDAKTVAHTGFIAEDLYTAGLDSYVIRGNDGSLESIQYDRLPILHHQLIRELYNRLDAAEMEIYKLKQEVEHAS